MLPNIMGNTLEQVGKMTIPLSMLLVGSLVASLSFEKMKIYLKNVYLWKATLYKLFIIPLILFVFYFYRSLSHN